MKHPKPVFKMNVIFICSILKGLKTIFKSDQKLILRVSEFKVNNHTTIWLPSITH